MTLAENNTRNIRGEDEPAHEHLPTVLPDENIHCSSSGCPKSEPMQHTSLSMTDATKREESKWLVRCLVSQGGLSNSLILDIVFHVLAVVLIYVLLLSLFEKEALPDGSVFNIFVLLILANIAGILFRMMKLPGLFGMLLVGIVLRSIGAYHISEPYTKLSTIAREFALAIILTKAGLALNPEVLKKKAFTVIKLSLLPCIGEAALAAVAAHYIIGLPWSWAIFMGLVLSPISPAVVVPTLIMLKGKGYGEDKGIATLVIAASAIDDIFSIVGFGVVLKIIFTAGDGLYTTLISGPLDVMAAIIIGLIWAFLCALIPNKLDGNVVGKRSAMIGMGGVGVVLGSTELDHSVIGSLASITASLFANISWCMQDPGNLKNNPVAHVFTIVWKYTEPVLFAMVGAEIDLKSIEPSMILYGIVIIAMGLMGRVIICYLALFGAGLNFKEVIFVVLAWLPKATVQAAISARALDIVRAEQNPDPELLNMATWILNTAILSIVLTAPIGSIAINLLGTKLLNKVPT